MKWPLLAILVTPAHVKLINSSEDLIPKLLRQIFHISQDSEGFDVLTAVVDRIPYPIFQHQAARTDQQNSAGRDIQGLDLREGSEGISFAVFDSKSAAPDLWSTGEDSTGGKITSSEQRCTLSFTFPSTKIVNQPFSWRCLHLPVANTIFQNGRIATLNAQKWRSQSRAGGLALSCIQNIPLPKQTLQMAEFVSKCHAEPMQLLHFCLIPITPARTVLAAVGNIVRRISVNGASESGSPASEELEKQISEAIKKGQIPAQQPGIWALVKTQGSQVHAVSAGSGRGTAEGNLQGEVFDGCHLRKVLSGGGGWGEKQGLLALDPDSGFNANLETSELLFGAKKNAETKELLGLNDIITPGDTIQFFVNSSTSYRGSASRSMPDESATNPEDPITMTLGSLPSTMDTMPQPPTSNPNKSLDTDYTVINNHFGMLSEQGMSLEVSISLECCMGHTEAESHRSPHLLRLMSLQAK